MPGRTPLCVVVLVSCALVAIGGIFHAASAKSVYRVIPEAQVNKAQSEAAQRTAAALLKSWSTGNIQQLPDTCSARMREALTPKAQKAAYAKIRKIFGEFKSMTFVEAGTSPKAPGAVLYRFKGTFGKAKKEPEIRVVVNDKGTVIGLFVVKWNMGL